MAASRAADSKREGRLRAVFDRALDECFRTVELSSFHRALPTISRKNKAVVDDLGVQLLDTLRGNVEVSPPPPRPRPGHPSPHCARHHDVSGGWCVRAWRAASRVPPVRSLCRPQAEFDTICESMGIGAKLRRLDDLIAGEGGAAARAAVAAAVPAGEDDAPVLLANHILASRLRVQAAALKTALAEVRRRGGCLTRAGAPLSCARHAGAAVASFPGSFFPPAPPPQLEAGNEALEAEVGGLDEEVRGIATGAKESVRVLEEAGTVGEGYVRDRAAAARAAREA